MKTSTWTCGWMIAAVATWSGVAFAQEEQPDRTLVVSVRDGFDNPLSDAAVHAVAEDVQPIEGLHVGDGVFMLTIPGSGWPVNKVTLLVNDLSIDTELAEVVLPAAIENVSITLRVGKLGTQVEVQSPDGDAASAPAPLPTATLSVGESTPGAEPGSRSSVCTSGVGCQLPDQMGHGAGLTVAATSDLNPSAGFRVADNFVATSSGSITSVCWWGLYVDFSLLVDCGPGTGDNFQITYYNDDAGGLVPGTVKAGPYAVTPVAAPTGLTIPSGIGPVAEYQYEATHSPVSINAGECTWIEIVNSTTGTCFWLWETAPPGDNRAAQDNGGYAATDYDMAFCLDVSTDADACGVPPPANDECPDAIGPLAVPSTTPGSTAGATTDSGFPFCGTGITSPGVWYTTIGTGNTMTASTCGPLFDYDTKISVYCKGCDTPTCVDGNDDSCSGGASGLLSTVSWCSQPGVEYLILVHGFGGASGAFELYLSDDGVPCSGAVTCVPEGACCNPDGSCTIETEADCDAAGGAYQGDGTNCGGADYSVQDCGNSFEDISGTGALAPNASNNDDSGDVVPIGFTFNFFGDDHTMIGIASNGYLTFGTDLSDFSNDPIPNSIDPNDAIFPYWDDYDPVPDGAGDPDGVVYYQTLGSAPNRRFVAQWTNMRQFANSDSNTFQAVLYEGSNCIEFRYGTITPRDATDVTVGIENQDGTAGVEVDASTISPGDCLEFCPEEPLVCPIQASMDIKPGSCPNSFNRRSHGVLPVALLGTDTFDVTQVDLSSLSLSRPDCEALDFEADPNAAIPDNDPGGISDTITVTEDVTVLDLNVDVQISHTWIGDLIIEIEHNGTTVRLWDENCGSNDDMVVIFDDQGNAVVCASPTIGNITTADRLLSLAAFSGMSAQGDWTIRVVDTFPSDTGTLEHWSLHFSCPGVAPNEGPPGPHSTFGDTGTPFDGYLCDCHDATTDGYTDLNMKFRTDDVVAGLAMYALDPGALVELTLTGMLLDGTPFEASDCVRLVPPGTPPGLVAVLQGGLPDAWLNMSPLDDQLDGGGFGDFDRSYPQSTVTTLGASETVGDKQFVGWKLDGIFQSPDLSTGFTVEGMSQTVEAIYRRPGDIIADDQVNMVDFLQFSTCYGTGPGAVPECPAEMHAASDLNRDGKIDLRDFNIFALNFGQ